MKQFQISDLLLIGAPAIACVAFGVIVLPSSLEAGLLLFTVALGFLAVYLTALNNRKKFLSKFKYKINGVYINPNGYLASKESFQVEIEWLKRSYDVFYKTDLKDVFVEFNNGPIIHNGARHHGLTFFGGGAVKVEYLDPKQPIEKTAFSHELGHVVIGRATKGWDEDTHHALMRRFGMP